MTRVLPRSLAARVAVAAGGAVAVAFAVAAVAVLLAATRGDRAALDRELRSGLERLQRPAVAIAVGGAPSSRFRGLRPGDRLPPPPHGALDVGVDRFVLVVGAGGELLRAFGALPQSGLPAPVPDGVVRTVQAGGERWRTAAAALPNGAAVEVGARLAPLEARAARLRRVVALALFVALAGSALAALLLTRLALAPLARLRAAAAGIGDTTDLGARVPVGGAPVEVDDLAHELNAMLVRLGSAADARERALASARRFAADAGHELRTPLMSLRASLATLRRTEREAAELALAAAGRDLDRLTRLVEQLQALARGEAGPPRTPEPLDLGEIADSALTSLRIRHPAAGLGLHCSDPGPIVRADPDGVRAMLDNVLENAARHGREGGRIEVAVAACRNGGAQVIVDDDGPGIPPEERQAVLGRFVRGAGARGAGTGLGLAIVAAEAERHAGSVSLAEGPLGGLRVTITLGGGGAATGDAREGPRAGPTVARPTGGGT